MTLQEVCVMEGLDITDPADWPAIAILSAYLGDS